MVPNLEIILWNVSTSYRTLAKFLDSWLAHALKVNIFQGLLLLRRAKAVIQTCRDKIKDPKLAVVKRIFFLSTFTSCNINILILVMFVGADEFLEILLDLQLFCILNQILAYVHTTFGNFTFEILSIALFWWVVVLQCYSGHKILHCAMEKKKSEGKSFCHSYRFP